MVLRGVGSMKSQYSAAPMMPFRSRRVAVFMATTLVLTAAASACSGDDKQTLTVYSGRHYGIETAFEKFEEETGVDVKFLTGKDGELRERIAAEGEDTEADVYLTVDAGNLWAAGEEGLFQPIDSEVLEESIPAELQDAENRWFAFAVRTRTIVYNTDTMDEADVPTTYEELAEPEWEGRICLRNSSEGYQQSLVASMIAADGEERTLEVLRGWAANAEIFANDIEIIEAIAAGACDVGVVNHYYLGRELEEKPDLPVGLVWAEQDGRGVHVNVSGGGVTRYADDVELGQQFLEWLATEGQDTLVADNHEYPANPEVAPEPLIAETFGTDFKRDELRADVLGSLNADAVRLMDEADFG
jgi:iron(III) transport system substrate-binding protein